MLTKSIVAALLMAVAAGCGSRGAVVYGGTPGSGGGGGGPAERDATATNSFVYTSDMPEECKELTRECSTCDEVEVTRRRILKKKCIMVCEPYVDAGPAFATNVAPAIDDILRKPGVCGKTSTTCSAVEKSQCRYALEYVSVARPFRTSWASTAEVPPPASLLSSYYDGVLTPVNELHRQVFEWGRVNEADVGPLMEQFTQLLRLRLSATSQEVLGEASSALPSEGEPGAERVRTMYTNAKSLSDTAMAPGGSFEAYQTAWDAANESFVTSRAAGK